MTSQDVYLGSQTTKRYDIPLSHLDYNYIESCKDEKELEKILKVLRSGDEGSYPGLEKLTETCLKQINPKNRLLRKETPVAHPSDLSKEEWSSISQDLSNWTSEMKSMDEKLRPSKAAEESLSSEDSVPIRSASSLVSGKKDQGAGDGQKRKRVAPRDYREWEKLDRELEKTLEKEDEEEPTAAKETKPARIGKLDISDEYRQKIQVMKPEDQMARAVREKEKGNESYRASDFEEAIHFYSKSLLCDPSSISTCNNRAMTYLQLKQWDAAIKDCNQVLQAESSNIKALLRRGSAYQGQKKWKMARTDFEHVLKMEPHNKRAKELLKEVQKAGEKDAKDRKEKGRRMVIEETEGTDSEEEEKQDSAAPATPNGDIATPNGHAATSSDCNATPGDSISVPMASSSTASSPASHVSIPTPTPAAQASVPTTTTPAAQASTPTATPAAEEAAIQAQGGEGEPSKQPKAAASETSKNIWEEEEVQEESASSSSYETYSASSPSVSSTFSETDLASKEEVLEERAAEAISRANRYPNPAFSARAQREAEARRLMEQQLRAAQMQRPIRRKLYRFPLLPHVLKFRREGNQFFQEGQFAQAIEQYTLAINYLEREMHQTVNLSLLYSNRAACKLKVGDSRAAKEDCDAALKLIPHSIKPLIRRALALENMEKYTEAYIDYRHACTVQAGLLVAQQGAARCQRVLQGVHGLHWRDYLPPLVRVRPDEIAEIVDAPEDGSTQPDSSTQAASLAPQEVCVTPHASESAPVERPQVSSSSSASITSRQSQASKPAGEVEDFDLLKERGNRMVRQGDFAAAYEIYTLCLTRKPENVPCLTNRALCNLKLKKYDLVIQDCNKALRLDPDNIKGLFRRAVAYKEKGQLRLGMEDLIKVLKLDPANGAAKREMEIVKDKYKEVYARERARQQHARFEERQRRQVQIEEFDEAQPQPRPRRRPGRRTGRGRRKAEGEQSGSNTGELSAASSSNEGIRGAEGGDSPTPPEAVQARLGGTEQLPGRADSAQAGTSHPSTARPPNSQEDHTGSTSPDHVRLPRLSGSELGATAKKGGQYCTGAKHPYWVEVAADSAPSPSVVRTTPFEFMSAWNSLKSSSTHLPYANLLRQTELEELPKLITNKLDGRMLQIFLKCAAVFAKAEDPLWSYRLLVNLSYVQRFPTVSMMMTEGEREDARSALAACEAHSSPHYSRSDLLCLRKTYGVL